VPLHSPIGYRRLEARADDAWRSAVGI